MVTNPFFNNTTYTPTQNLFEDLIIENIKMNGLDFIYVPRTLVNVDELYLEDAESLFASFFTIEMYPDNVQDFGNQSDFLSKFGLEIRDEFNLTVAKKRFQEETEMTRPLEGDLIYFPLSRTLFQIDFVEHENPFYQQGKLFCYQLTCSTYDFGHDSFETGNEEIDSTEDDLENLNSVLNDSYQSNTTIQQEGEDVLSFDETNPFGDY